jgi:hypothetical protein
MNLSAPERTIRHRRLFVHAHTQELRHRIALVHLDLEER